MNYFLKIGTVCLLSIFFGCVKIPTEEAEYTLSPIPSLENMVQAAYLGSEFYEGDFPKSDWWEMFGDEQLSELICQALASNPDLKAAEQRVKQAEAYAKIKRSFLFPTLGFQTQFELEYVGKNDYIRAYAPSIPGNLPQYQVGLDFSYEIDFWSRNKNFFRSALSLTKAQEAERQSAILMLSTSIANVYFKLQTYKKKLEILEKEKMIFQEIVEITQKREENSLDNRIEILSAEQLFLENQKNILFTEQMIDLSHHMLLFLIGASPETNEEILKICFHYDMKIPLPRHLSSNLLARRPDLIALLWSIESAAHLVGAAKADFYPRVDLFALGGVNSTFLSKIFSWSSRTATFEPAIYLPIFTAGRIKANLKQKEAEFRELLFRYNNAILHAAKEVADQVSSLQFICEKLKTQDLLVKNKKENQQLVAGRYRNAISSKLDVLQAEEALLREEFSRVEFQFKRLSSTIELIKALGGGYFAEEVPFE